MVLTGKVNQQGVIDERERQKGGVQEVDQKQASATVLSEHMTQVRGHRA
jgi:hypothetical protein